MDLGSRAEPLLPVVPTLLIDHHQPTGIPEGGTLISGSCNEFRVARFLVRAVDRCRSGTRVDGCGEHVCRLRRQHNRRQHNRFPELAAVVHSTGTTRLRNVTALLNAPRRTSTGDANAVLRMVLEERHGDRGAFLRPGASHDLLLTHNKKEVDASFARGRKTPPCFAGNVALIQIHEECQVHSLIAQTWQSRLRKQIVICANTGYLPGRVGSGLPTV